MNSFKIEDVEIGVSFVEFSSENGELMVDICGNNSIFLELAEKYDWAGGYQAPRLYFYGLPYQETMEVKVDRALLEAESQYDFALEMEEFYDIAGTLRLSNKNLIFEGIVDMGDEKYPVEVSVEL